MPASFAQTMRALAADKPHRPLIIIAVASVFLAAWLTWFLGARVAIYEVSRSARLEAQPAAYRIDTPVAGRILAFHLALGAEVTANSIVAQLECETQKARLAEEKARLASLSAEINALRGLLHTRAQADQRELTALEQRQRLAAATIEGLVTEIDKRTIRAPISGVVEDIAQITAGAYVREGDKLGVIVPKGKLRAVAELTPATAVGRVRVGQLARLRFDGFPWAKYGEIAARVTSVGHEPTAGQVRVELELLPSDGSSRIPLQHGMTATAQIEIERVAPATLVLVEAGELLSATPAASAAASKP